jgi:hypothetical protein
MVPPSTPASGRVDAYDGAGKMVCADDSGNLTPAR